MTFIKTIHSITALPVHIIYICIVSPNRNARSSNSFVYCHPFIMKATVLLKSECFPTVIRTNMLVLSISHSSPRIGGAQQLNRADPRRKQAGLSWNRGDERVAQRPSVASFRSGCLPQSLQRCTCGAIISSVPVTCWI